MKETIRAKVRLVEEALLKVIQSGEKPIWSSFDCFLFSSKLLCEISFAEMNNVEIHSRSTTCVHYLFLYLEQVTVRPSKLHFLEMGKKTPHFFPIEEKTSVSLVEIQFYHSIVEFKSKMKRIVYINSAYPKTYEVELHLHMKSNRYEHPYPKHFEILLLVKRRRSFLLLLNQISLYSIRNGHLWFSENSIWKSNSNNEISASGIHSPIVFQSWR